LVVKFGHKDSNTKLLQPWEIDRRLGRQPAEIPDHEVATCRVGGGEGGAW
jgi:hypothetical protein